MANRPQDGTRRSSDLRFQKSPHDKSKSKPYRQNAKGTLYHKDASVPSLNEVAEKAVSGLNNLGSQRFALSPFSQYFDDWLMNVRVILSEFESNPAVAVDEEFTASCSQIISKVERDLAEKRLKENSIEASATALSEAKHLLEQLDSDYAAQTRTLSQKRSTETETQTKRIHVLEEEIAFIEQMKNSFFNPLAKRKKSQQIAEVNQKLTVAKSELATLEQNFTVEQETLQDEYTTKKQATIEKVQNLEKEIADIEIDLSVEIRQTTCNELTNTIRAFLQRKPASAQ